MLVHGNHTWKTNREMIDKSSLFFEEDLDSQLGERQGRVSEIVDGIQKDQFLVSTDADLIEHVVAGLLVEPLVLCEEAIKMSPSETQVDVSGDLENPSSHAKEDPPTFPELALTFIYHLLARVGYFAIGRIHGPWLSLAQSSMLSACASQSPSPTTPTRAPSSLPMIENFSY